MGRGASPTAVVSTDSFAESPDICDATKAALTRTMKLERMTEIQAKTLLPALAGMDVGGTARGATAEVCEAGGSYDHSRAPSRANRADALGAKPTADASVS